MLNNKSLDEKILRTGIAINNALEKPVLLETFRQYGYTAERLNEGLSLLERLKITQDAKRLSLQRQCDFTEFIKVEKGKSRAKHVVHRQIAGVAFGDSSSLRIALGINKRLPDGLSAYLSRAGQFYGVALADSEIQTTFAGFGIPIEELREEARRLETIEALMRRQEICKGKARQAVLDRDKALAELEAWTSAFAKIAGIAFRGKPQLLEALQIKVKSSM